MDDQFAKERIKHLEKHLRDVSTTKTATTIAQQVLYSYRHANRLFFSAKGESIQAFANKIRMQRAAEYLKYSALPVLQIALVIGYESTASFSKAFKKIYKCAPTQFRRENKPRAKFAAESLPFTETYFEEYCISLYRCSLESKDDFEAYYNKTKAMIHQLHLGNMSWSIVWEEDPTLSMVSDTRFFIGSTKVSNNNLRMPDRQLYLNGRYAIFDAETLAPFNYRDWHELITIALEISGKELRDGAYLEYFSSESLISISHFVPSEVAVPIQ
ncbi:MAG: helix-turn-helix transcriptional regulator [Bacteroidota bacterium]